MTVKLGVPREHGGYPGAGKSKVLFILKFAPEAPLLSWSNRQLTAATAAFMKRALFPPPCSAQESKRIWDSPSETSEIQGAGHLRQEFFSLLGNVRRGCPSSVKKLKHVRKQP
jgi:hypothetical protein